MCLLSSKHFQEQMEMRYDSDFSTIKKDQELVDLFHKVEEFVDTDLYVKVLSHIDMFDYDNFQRFFFTSLRKHYDKEGTDDSFDDADFMELIKGDALMQTLCISCIQYYFL